MKSEIEEKKMHPKIKFSKKLSSSCFKNNLLNIFPPPNKLKLQKKLTKKIFIKAII